MGHGRAEGQAVPRSALRVPSSYAPHTLRHDLKSRGRLPIDECVELGLALTSALDHLHQNGLVHRDIKPSNIIFVNGQPKLADIGLVAGVGEARSFVGTEAVRPRVSQLLSNNVAALEWCRRGDEYHRVFSLERKTLAKAAFHEAKILDPNCTRALAGLLWVNRGMVYYRSHRDSWPEVVSLSHDILRIDDTDQYARAWLAGARIQYEWNWGAGAAALKAADLEPGNYGD